MVERKKPIRNLLVPKTVNLRPSSVFDTPYTYQKAMESTEESASEGESLSSEYASPPFPPSGASMKDGMGEACLPCSKNHVAAIAGVLSESMRFAREGGLKDPSVKERIGIATEELAAMERVDLHPAKVKQLSGTEKEVANWVLEKARSLRHTIDRMKTPGDLEKAIEEASSFNSEMSSKFVDLMVDL